MAAVKPIRKKFGEKKVASDSIRSFFKNLFTFIGHAASLDVGDTIEAGSALITDRYSFEDDPEDRSFEWVLRGLVNGVHNLSIVYRQQMTEMLSGKEKLYDDARYLALLDGLTDKLKKTELVIDKDFFQRPDQSAIAKVVSDYLNQFFVQIGMNPAEATIIAGKFPYYFTEALDEEWAKSKGKYDGILAHIHTPVEGARRRQEEWLHYGHYLQRQAEEPIFGESFSLKDIYIPLRAYCMHQNKEDAATHEKKEKYQVFDLQKSLNDWLKKADKNDAIRVISGGPGSGKSSFAKWWASQLAEKDTIKVLYVPLHRLNLQDHVRKAVGNFLQYRDGIRFSYNPMEELLEEERILLIFDGLDELVMQGRRMQESVRDFVDHIKDILRDTNAIKTRLLILLTGRPIAVQNTESDFRDSEMQIVHLLPYLISQDFKEKVINKGGLLDKDFRNHWWKKYAAIKGLDHIGLPEQVRTQKLDPLTAEPLLNYLVALALREHPDKFTQHTNQNEIYRLLIEGVFERKYVEGGLHKSIKDVVEKPDKFLLILEEVALSAWLNGDVRVARATDIAKRLEKRNLLKYLDDYQKSVDAGVSRLLTAFYFKKHAGTGIQDDSATFEFTHKSFGEYLVARAIMRLLEHVRQKLSDQSDSYYDRYEERQAMEQWLELCGRTVIDFDIMTFLGGEAELRFKEGTDLLSWQRTIGKLIEFTLANDIPFSGERQSYSEEAKQARNAKTALMIVHSCIAKCTRTLLKISWNSDPEGFSRWYASLLLHMNPEGTPVSSSFNYLDLQGQNLRFANFPFCEFENSKLQGVEMQGANLVVSILNNIDLISAKLNAVNLVNASLYLANLSGANLSYANLGGANLHGANLSGANLSGANLSYADLSGANLSGAMGLVIEQIASAQSIVGTLGIPSEWIEQLQVKKKDSVVKKIKNV